MREPENNYKPIFQFYRHITETQKATTREITEELKPIKEGIENLPQAIKFPPIQLLGEASGEASKEAESKEAESKKSPEHLGEIAYNCLHREALYPSDKTFGIYQGKDGHYHMGKQTVKEGRVKEIEKKNSIAYNNILIDYENLEAHRSMGINYGKAST